MADSDEREIIKENVKQRSEEEEEKQNKDKRKGTKNPTVKSCKGFLHDSSVRKSQDRNPRCIGVTGSIQPPPGWTYSFEKSKAPTNQKEGFDLKDFYYACAGYSVYVSRNEGSVDKEAAKSKLPGCIGVEFIRYRQNPDAGTASAPARVHSRESPDVPQPRTNKPTNTAEDDFLNRFTKNANIVALGVARNMSRVGNYMTETAADILFPDRKRPK